MTPTPEQIEAAARAIFENMSDIDGDEADWIHFRDDCMEGAKAALLAAAGVGEKKPMTNLEWEIANNLCVIGEVGEPSKDRAVRASIVRNAIDHTIERCARVAENAADKAMSEHKTQGKDEYLWCYDEANGIASAIRALKDKP